MLKPKQHAVKSGVLRHNLMASGWESKRVWCAWQASVRFLFSPIFYGFWIYVNRGGILSTALQKKIKSKNGKECDNTEKFV